MVKHERSAGVVVVTDAASKGRRYLLLDYGRHWDFPKGHLEKGEDDRTAALRELAEETGLTDVVLLPDFAQTIEYFFRTKKDGLIHKHVIFFLAVVDNPVVKLSHEHVGHALLDYIAAAHRLTYPAARKVLEAAEAFLVARSQA